MKHKQQVNILDKVVKESMEKLFELWLEWLKEVSQSKIWKKALHSEGIISTKTLEQKKKKCYYG